MSRAEDAVLNALREAADAFVSGEDISRRLKVSRTAVWKGVEVLRELGYEIDGEPKRGYRLLSVPDKLFADEISRGLDVKTIGSRILSYEAVDSTNDVAMDLGERGMPEGTCVLAEYQKKGRGRMGRAWVSPKGKNLILSVLLRPALSASELPRITLLAGVTAVRAVRAVTGIRLGIKWPNDLYYQDRKVCGILTEMKAETDKVRYAVMGIGLNVNAAVSELPPQSVSLKKIARKAVSRVELAREFLRQLDGDYARFKKEGFRGVMAEWEEHSITTGKPVTVQHRGKSLRGQAVGIDEDGALWVRRDNGIQERVTAGNVSHDRRN